MRSFSLSNIPFAYMKTFLSTSLLLFGALTFAQNSELFSPYEMSLTDKEEDRLLETLKSSSEFLTMMEAEYFSEEWDKRSVEDYIHFIDLDVDGDADAIYQGPSGGEGDHLNIWLNIENESYKEATGFFKYQEIAELNMNENGLSYLYITTQGCCADPRFSTRQYTIEMSKDSLEAHLIYSTVEIATSPHSIDYFVEPIEITTTLPEYNLRITPEIDTTTDHYFSDADGNIAATFAKGTRGVAFGSYKDETGRIWYLVHIPTDQEAIYSVFDTPVDDVLYVKGWMSSTYLAEVETDY